MLNLHAATCFPPSFSSICCMFCEILFEELQKGRHGGHLACPDPGIFVRGGPGQSDKKKALTFFFFFFFFFFSPQLNS